MTGIPSGRQRTGKRVLFIRLSAIGDVVVTTPVTRVLREHDPDAYLAWVVEPQAAAILAGNPYVDEIIIWQRRKGGPILRELRDVGRVLRPLKFDWVIDFQGLLRSALVARVSGARRIVGNTAAKEHAHLLYHDRVPRDPADLSSRQRCLDLLQPLGIRSSDRKMVIAISDYERESGRQALREAGIAANEPYACLVPATTWKQKHWFEEEWGKLAALLPREMGLTPVLLGGPGDIPLAERIRAASGVHFPVLAGRTTLKSAAAVLEGAALTIAVDTGLLHASVAVGTPTVGVCGASWWKGFSDYERFALVREPLPCSPCLHRPTCQGRYDCMRALTPQRVLSAVQSLLSGRDSGRPDSSRS